MTALAFLPSGSVVVSASLDGTVRAFDLVRYRNFRTMTAPHPVQFVSLAVDPAGEVTHAAAPEPATVSLVLMPALILQSVHQSTRTVRLVSVSVKWAGNIAISLEALPQSTSRVAQPCCQPFSAAMCHGRRLLHVWCQHVR